MNSNSLSRHHHSSQPFKQLPLQPHNKNSQGYTIITQPHKDKALHKSYNPSQQQSFSSKSKSIRHQNSKENLPDSRTTTISITSKIPDEKRDSVSIPFHSVKSIKPGHPTEKSFQDLNKSLANLASKRCIVRSSSDNEAIGRLNHTESDLQRSYGPSHHHMESQYVYNSISATPFSSKRTTQNFQNFQSSVQKETEVTPFSFVNQINRESVKPQNYHGTRDPSSKDLTLSDLGYGKLQNSIHDKSGRPSQNTHYWPADTRARSHARNFATEGSCQMEFSQIDNLDNTDSQCHTLSQYLCKDIQLSYLNGECCQEIGTENLGESDFENTLETVRHLSGKEEQDSLNKVHQMKTSQQNYRNTPSFKGKDKLKKSSSTLSSNPRRYSDLTSIPRVTEKKMDKSVGGQRRNCGKLELNHISDGVEYTMGGVGMNNQLRKKKADACNKSTFTEVNHSNSRFEGIDNVRRETLDIWRHDIMNIKKEMETRKKSYAEVNKFMKMHDNGKTVSQPRNTRESSFDIYATRKTANMSSLNTCKLDKAQTMKPYSSGFKDLHGNVRDLRRQSKKKISLELRTVEDYNDQSSALSNLRVKTAPYCDLNNETNEANTFMYDDNFLFEETQRQACCGPEKMCNIF